MNYQEKAELLSKEQKSLFIRNGFNVSGPEKMNYAYELTVTGTSGRVKVLTYFSQKGNKIVLQGNKETEMYITIYNLLFGETLFGTMDETPEPEEYIGTDESGKGDFFGPLVVAGVYVNKNMREELRRAGVRDSKILSGTSIRVLEKIIKNVVGNKFNIISIFPEKYNLLYEKFGNLNLLLGWAHAKVLENILEGEDTDTAISDKFGDERYIIKSLQAKGKNLRLLQYHRAEKYTAVAAASILARGKMLDWFSSASIKYNIEIPKGASAAVEQTAKIIKEKFGAEVLNQLTKKHFKTTKNI